MVKVSGKQYEKLLELAKGLSKVSDLKCVICDAGECPVPIKDCFCYYSEEQDILCPVLIEVCKRLKSDK